MNIRCPECSTEFEMPDNPDNSGPGEAYCPGCGHGIELDRGGETSPNKTQLGVMGKVPSPGQVADEDSDPDVQDYNPFPDDQDEGTSPGHPTPGQPTSKREEPETEPPSETPESSEKSDTAPDRGTSREANPSDPSFGAVEADSGETTTESSDAGDDEDDFWSSGGGDEYDAFAPDSGTDSSFDADREFFDPDAPGSRTGGSRTREPASKNSSSTSNQGQPASQVGGGKPASEVSSQAEADSPASGSSAPPEQPPSPGIQSDSEGSSSRTTTSTTPDTAENEADRTWTGEDEPAVQSGPSTTLAQKVAYLALIVLIVVNGLLGFIAYKNAWMIDFVKFEQMLEVAFEGGTYEPREEWTKE
jgi:hypothetical protein